MKTNKQFVTHKHPQAVCERHKNAEGKTIWIVKNKKGGDFISVAYKSHIAWEQAKEVLQLKQFNPYKND